jgi:F-type H+-transporting ATPase subunit gamma
LANQKEIRTRIGSVKNTQKITRAMKMVAGARLNRAQVRIQEMRPYAQQTALVLRSVVGLSEEADPEESVPQESSSQEGDHPLLSVRPRKCVLLLVVTSDRGLCGAFNSSILRHAEREWQEFEAAGVEVKIYVIGRKGREYFIRRKAPLVEYFDGIWDDLGLPQARRVARSIIKPFATGEVDEIRLVYNEFKSAMTQLVTNEVLFPLQLEPVGDDAETVPSASLPFIFEPDKKSLLDVLVPMYIEVTLLRALYESMASELGARMTAMDSATKNANDMIESLTLQYNRARQAAITTELMEIIGGAEALNA